MKVRAVDDHGHPLKFPFTDKGLRELKPPTSTPQAGYTDAKLPGFQYVLGRGGPGTFSASFYRDGKKTRERIGAYDEMTLPEARAAAKAVLGRIAEGKATPGDARRAAKSGPTLEEATRDYLATMEHAGCRPKSIAIVRSEMLGKDGKPAKYLADWLARPLRSLTARECRDRHVELTKCGPHLANRVMRTLRAVWNHVADEAPEDDPWPSPCTRSVQWHVGKKPGFTARRQEPIPWSRLPTWRQAVEQLDPMRRDYRLFVLFSGLRKMDAATLRWEHLNLKSEIAMARVWDITTQQFVEKELPPRSLVRPMPKGGAAKAFILPLSEVMVEILRRRLEDNRRRKGGDGGWVFPITLEVSKPCAECEDLGCGAHVAGTVSHMFEAKKQLVEMVGPDRTLIRYTLPSPHRLRDTYLTASEEAGVPEGVGKRLVNHTFDEGDVTARYRLQDVEYLRACQEKTSALLLAKMQPPTPVQTPREPYAPGPVQTPSEPYQPHLHLVA